MALPLLLLALACGTAPDAPPTPAPAPPPAAATPAAGARWSVDQLAAFTPTLPTHSAQTPTPMAAWPELDAAMALLGEVVDSRAGDPNNAWAISHGLLARGQGLVLSNGQPAVPWLFQTYAEPLPTTSGTLLRFPAKKGEIRVEPHTSLLLKSLTEAGVSPDQQVSVGGAQHPVLDLYRGTLASTSLDVAANRSSFKSPDDVPWALQGLAAWAPPGLAWTASDGTPMDLDGLTRFTVAVLVKETGFLAEAMAKGEGFERKGQGIFNYTCGGAHLLQGAAYAVARGFGGPADRAALEAQIPIWYYRFPRELAIYDQAMKALPEHRLRLLVQRLKFAGHFLESMHKMAALGLYTPDAAQQETLTGAAREVVSVARTLSELGVLGGLDALRAQDEQLYLDVVGDSAHALRGLELALGRGSLAW